MFRDDIDGILAWMDKDSKSAHVMTYDANADRYHVFMLGESGKEHFLHTFERPSSALREFANRIDEHYK